MSGKIVCVHVCVVRMCVLKHIFASIIILSAVVIVILSMPTFYVFY